MPHQEIKVTSKGQITLPKAIRNRLKIAEGDYLQVELKGGELVLRPAPKNTGQELLLAYARENSKDRVGLQEVRRLFAALPLSVSEQVSKIREEESRE